MKSRRSETWNVSRRTSSMRCTGEHVCPGERLGGARGSALPAHTIVRDDSGTIVHAEVSWRGDIINVTSHEDGEDSPGTEPGRDASLLFKHKVLAYIIDGMMLNVPVAPEPM